MQPKLLITTLLCLLLAFTAEAQSRNPFKSIGKNAEVVTLTNGQYDEFFDDDSIQQIGTAWININTMKVVKLQLTKKEQHLFDNSLDSRFLSVDPISAKYPELTPYQFASNRPIDGVDEDGLEYHPAGRYNGMAVDATAVKLYPLHPAVMTQVKQEMPKVAEELMQTGWRIQMAHVTQSQTTPATVGQGQNFQSNIEAQQHQAMVEQKLDDAGYNADGTPKLLTRLADNKTFQRAADNILLPIVYQAASDGIFNIVPKGGSFLFNETAGQESNLWKVGPYNELKGLDPGLDAHHVGQQALMKKFVPGYDVNTAPSILVPQVGHTIRGPLGIVSRSTFGLTNARQVLARDIFELRKVYQDVPNDALQKLAELNKSMYPNAFLKK